MNLVVVQGSMSLEARTASAWSGFEDAARTELRWDPTITSPAGAHRSEAMVLDMFLSSPARRKAVYGVPLGTGVARPKSLGGSGSVHESGLCVDVANHGSVDRKKLVSLAKRFGFTFTIGTEPWHMEHNGSSGGSGAGGAATTKQEREQGMRNVRNWETGDIWARESRIWWRMPNTIDVAGTAKAYAHITGQTPDENNNGPWVNLSGAEIVLAQVADAIALAEASRPVVLSDEDRTAITEALGVDYDIDDAIAKGIASSLPAIAQAVRDKIIAPA